MNVYAIVLVDHENRGFDEIATSLLEARGTEFLFMTNPLVATDGDVTDPDFDVRVWAHGHELEPAEEEESSVELDPFCDESGVRVSQCVGCQQDADADRTFDQRREDGR